MKSPLGEGRDGTEDGPDHEIPGKKNARHHEGIPLFETPAVYSAKREDHGRRGRCHHRHHHHCPHDERQKEITGSPNLHPGHGHLHSHARRFSHGPGEMHHVRPGDHGHPDKA